MTFLRRALKRSVAAIGNAIISAVIVAMGGAIAVSYFSSDTFQAAMKRAQKETVPRGWYHVYVCLWTGCDPGKVIDPADPRFRPEYFRFEDYPANQQLDYVISRIIKPGMSRAAVEDILVRSGHAVVVVPDAVRAKKPDKTLTDAETILLYSHVNYYSWERDGWTIRVKYDGAGDVVSVHRNGEDITQK